MPINSMRPVGTVEELTKLRANLAAIPSCSAPVRGSNVGCPVWNRCRFEEKGRSGPFFAGAQMIQITTNGPRETTEALACYEIVQKTADIESNGGLVKVVAREGVEIKSLGSKKVLSNPNDPTSFTWKTDLYPVTVPRHQRPAEMEEFRTLAYLEREREKKHVATMEERESQIIGVLSPTGKDANAEPERKGTGTGGKR